MTIKNENLKIFLQTIFNKGIGEITSNDLSSVYTLPLVGENDNNSNFRIDYSDLDLFPNLNELVISNSYVDLNDLEIIKKHVNIMKICFNKCVFKNKEFPLSSNVLELELVGCYITDYTFLQSMNWLNTLIISNPYTEKEIDLSYLSGMVNLKKLILDRCLLHNFDSLVYLNKLEYLSLLWTLLPNNYTDIFNKLSMLKKLYISEKYDISFIRETIEVKTNLNEFTYDIYTDKSEKR